MLRACVLCSIGWKVYRKFVAYLALQGADEQAVEDLAGFVRVANIFEGFG